MGQTTHGLLYGVTAPKGVAIRDYDNESDAAPGLLDDWNVARGGRATRRDCGIEDAHAEYRGARREPLRLVGIWIAVGASGIDGVPNYDTQVALSRIATTRPYSVRLSWAQAEWTRFHAWCAARGVALGTADLWLTTLEVS